MADDVGKFNLKVGDPDTSKRPTRPSLGKGDRDGYRVGSVHTRPNVRLLGDFRGGENAAQSAFDEEVKRASGKTNCDPSMLAGLSQESQTNYWFAWAKWADSERSRGRSEWINPSDVGNWYRNLVELLLFLTKGIGRKASTARSKVADIMYMHLVNGKPYFAHCDAMIKASIKGIEK